MEFPSIQHVRAQLALLEQAVGALRSWVGGKDDHPLVQSRIAAYEEIVAKQRQAVVALREAVLLGDRAEALQSLKRIRALSLFVHTDAINLLRAAHGAQPLEQRPEFLM